MPSSSSIQRMSRLKLWMTPVRDGHLDVGDFKVWSSDDSSDPIRFSRGSSRNSSADGSTSCSNESPEEMMSMKIGIWKPLPQKTCGFCYIQYKRHCQKLGISFPRATDPGFWVGHTTKDDRGDVICPELRKLKCPLCYASGKKAHTLKFSCSLMACVSEQLELVSEMIKTCAVDVRDVWPTNAENYTKTESITRGAFGIVRFAEASDPAFSIDGLENRSCVIKTIYLQRRFEAILKEIPSTIARKSVQENDLDHQHTTKISRFYRRMVMELYVLCRCRHANIMHLHALFISNGDLHMVLPRLYVLENLSMMYKRRKQSEPIPVTIIAKILRQLCLALDYLQKIGISHRAVQPDNVFLTRGGTVKLGHFAQSRALFEESLDDELCCCKSPVGREEFMSFEKQHNLYFGTTLTDCVGYSFSADIWSLGVLVLAMVSYYPEEQSQKLHKNFAMAMHQEQMPFIWLTVDMLQLRSRLVKSGGEELKLFLSDCLLTLTPKRRVTAAELPKTAEMKKWCLPTVEEDSKFLRKHLIDEVDFANHLKLESDSPNYDVLETKDIPAEFYWDDTWKKLDDMELIVQIFMPPNYASERHRFKFSDSEPLFRILYTEIVSARIEFTDLLTLDFGVKQSVFDFVQKNCADSAVEKKMGNRAGGVLRRQIKLPSSRSVEVEIRTSSPPHRPEHVPLIECPLAVLSSQSPPADNQWPQTKTAQMFKWHFSFLFLVFSVILLCWVLYDRSVDGYVFEFKNTTLESDALIEVPPPTKPVILLWTPVFRHNSLKLHSDCPFSEQCFLTYDRRALGHADAVVYHIPDIKWTMPSALSSSKLADRSVQPDFPEQNAFKANAVNVFFSQENPSTLTYYYQSKKLEKAADKFFHWTMTYLRSSDFPMPYGGFWVPPEETRRLGFSDKRVRGAVWFVSNCHTESKRELAVEALSKHFLINVGGKCAKTEEGQQLCPRTEPSCDHVFAAHYFFIAAENDICREYVTEKYWSRYQLPSVPIVMRKYIYEGIVPNNSYIAMDQFESPKAMADHLNFLMNNPDEYLKYFEWRAQNWSIAPWNHQGFRIGKLLG
uniref:Fucosyltransferase n=1 Tax=Globodera rostochiensis TaxID=31243 RepID=A0A914HM17_GLORO